MPASPNAIYEHAVRLYDAMKSESKRAKVEGVSCNLWEGFATHLVSDLHIPVPYYGQVLNALKLMGCVRLAKRGARTVPSKWVLYKKPTRKDFDAIRGQLKTSKRRADIEATEQKVRDVAKSVGGVDVPKVVAALQKDITTLKGRVSKLEKGRKAS